MIHVLNISKNTGENKSVSKLVIGDRVFAMIWYHLLGKWSRHILSKPCSMLWTTTIKRRNAQAPGGRYNVSTSRCRTDHAHHLCLPADLSWGHVPLVTYGHRPADWTSLITLCLVGRASIYGVGTACSRNVKQNRLCLRDVGLVPDWCRPLIQRTLNPSLPATGHIRIKASPYVFEKLCTKSGRH